MINTKNECEKKLILLDSNIKKQSDINKKVINNITKLQKMFKEEKVLKSMDKKYVKLYIDE
jgi:hypothetical protein